jgi:hypothetical protein
MTDKKKATPLKASAATQKISKDELADLLKKAEEEDPEAEENVPTAQAEAKPPAKKK